MLGTRGFANILTKSGSLMKPGATLHKSWSCSFNSSSRTLTSIKTPSGFTNPKPTDMNLINKRFYQSGDSNGSSSSSSILSSKLFAAFGLLFGIGTGAAYKAIVGNETIFGNQLFVDCADICGTPPPKEEDKCGCKNKNCVEKQCKDSPCLRKLECEEDLIMKANCELEKAIKETKGKAIEYTEAAMKAYCEAITIMCEFLNHGYCIIDNDELETPQYEESWCCIYDIAKKRCEKVRDALEKGQCAWELLCRLREVIENGRACKFTSCNPLLDIAEEALLCAEKELLTLKSRMDCVASEHDMVETYKSVIENFKADLKSDVEKEIASMECCDIRYAEQEMALMIIAGYKQVLRNQKAMAQRLVCEGKVPERFKCTCC